MHRGGLQRRRVSGAAIVASGILLILIALFDAGAGSADAVWPIEAYDPALNPAGDDRYLPMPCGGKMAFRRIDTTTLLDEQNRPAWLNDLKIQIGYAGTDRNAVEYLQPRYVQGAFADPAGNSRYFYMGKYEVTRGQYAAVMSPDCPDTNDIANAYPANDLSWFDAVAFTQRYSEWLYEKAAEALPPTSLAVAGGADEPSRAFIRLPTEEEWEYAARGGGSVSPEAFRGPRYPFAEGESLADHAWYFGPESSRGELGAIGFLQANPLGLHDLLGNAEELLLEPFRLNRANRHHGQAGGFVTKGGSFRLPAEDIRTSRRDEYGYFDPSTGAATRLDTFGFRVVLSAPVQTDVRRIDEIEAAWQQITKWDPLSPDTRDPLVVLRHLATQTDDATSRDVINSAVGELINERGQRADLEAETLRTLIASGGYAGTLIKDSDDRVARAKQALDFACKTCRETESERACNACRATYPEALQAHEENLANAHDIYVSNLLTISETFPRERWGGAVNDVKTSMRDRGLQFVPLFIDLFVAHVRAHQADGTLDLPSMTQDIRDVSIER